jgi:ribosome biogenesis protein UTP30
MQRQKKIEKPKGGAKQAKETQPAKETKPVVQKKDAQVELDNKLVVKACHLIRQLNEKAQQSSKNLFEISKHHFIYANVVLNELPTTSNIKPVRIELPSSIYGPEFSTKHVMIVSTEFKQAHKEALRTLKENWKFISYEKISKNYKQYKDKIALLKDYDLFFSEGRIYILLKKHLGKHFYEQKRYPHPVDFEAHVNQNGELDVEKFKGLLNSLVHNSTYFVQGNGPEYSIKVARVDKLTDAQLASNVRAGVKGLVKILVERGIKPENVRRVILRGEQTESFPIYSHLTPEEKQLMAQIVNGKVN